MANTPRHWTATDIEPRTKIVLGIGSLASQPRGLVAQASQCQVGIHNDNALRYGVPVEIWHPGIAIAEWVDTLKPTPP